MKIEIDLDIESIIKSAVTTERLQPLVDKAITEAIKDAITDATGYRSGFRDELKKQLAEFMPHGLKVDECAKFQQVANRAISEAVSGVNAATIKTAITDAISSVIPDVPQKVKLSELVKGAREDFMKEGHEAFYACFEASEYGGGWLYLDDDENCRNKYSAKIRLAFNKEGEVYSTAINGKNITPKGLPDVVGKFDGVLLAMYVGRTSIDADIDSDDVKSLACEQDND